jgi:phosphate starvation-inducible protein PhoH and related proteins
MSQFALLLEPNDNERLSALCGPMDQHLKALETGLSVQVHRRGNAFQIDGTRAAEAAEILEKLYGHAKDGIDALDIHLLIRESGMAGTTTAEPELRAQRGVIRGRGAHQREYLNLMRSVDLTFGVGPAGTGKTYLAIGCAVEALQTDRVRRIVLVRPAVEAGERLGFLPGDLSQKVDPYLRPMYDALYDFLGYEKVARLIERQIIEIAPLAFMRGRTLNESFVIMDEAQNSTVEQMKMFLTRIGFGSKAVVTGDITQTDLPTHKLSGLKHVIGILPGIQGVGFTFFDSRDVVRHPLVQRIVQAYERSEPV